MGNGQKCTSLLLISAAASVTINCPSSCLASLPVMGVSVEQWRAAIGSYNARQSCSLVHFASSSSQVLFLLSVLCFVAATLQQAVMTALMLLILLSGDVERNPGPRNLDDRPTMPQLVNFTCKTKTLNVAEQIGQDYFAVGVELLNDKTGVKVCNIESQHRGNIRIINTNILCDWLQGKGISDCTWRGLLCVLRVHCAQLARDIEETLQAEEDPSICMQEPPAENTLLADESSGSAVTSTAAGMPGPTPTQQRSTLSRFSDELRARYAKYQLPHFSNPQSIKWMPHVSKEYIHPDIARKEDQEEQPDTHKEGILQGGCHFITEEGSDEPVQLAELLIVEPGERCEVVLVEGAPGIGKSTLAWQVCHLWGKRELFDQYSTVLLLPLRDKSVQEAKKIEDLLFHTEDKKAQVEAKQEMGTGCGTLIILDGLDELPHHLLSQRSIFTDLLSGEVLGDATILVTSRPSATQQLQQAWKQRLSKHFVICGFSESNIESYTQSILSGEKLTEFQKYLSIHPHVQSLMYIPLHSAIVMAVYMRYKQFPKTRTELYKWLVKIILDQYLKDNPEGNREEQVFDLTLPSQVYANFKQLCRFAFHNICSQQLIFSHLPEELHNLGFTNSVPELLLPGSSSYNFLHLTVQEFLAAYHVSHMSPHEQEQLLLRSREEEHFRNMMRVVAGLTRFKCFNREALQQVIQVLADRPREGHYLLDSYSVKLLYECQDVSALDSENTYEVHLDHHSLCHSLAVGYCISHSRCAWKLVLWAVDRREATSLAMFIQGLTDSRTQPGYTIDYIRIIYRSFLFGQFPPIYKSILKLLLLQAPEYFLAHIKHLNLGSSKLHWYNSEEVIDLCPWLKTSSCKLDTLTLGGLRSNHIEMLSEYINEVSSLTTLRLNFPDFTLQSMQALASMLQENRSLTELTISSHKLDDYGVYCLAEALHSNTTLRKLNIRYVGERGAKALKELLEHSATPRELKIVLYSGVTQ